MYLQRPGALAGTIDIALLDGDIETARSRFAELEDYVTSRDMKDQMPLLMYTRAQVAAGAGEHEEALATLDGLVDAAGSFGMRRILLDVHEVRATSLDALSRPDEASAARVAGREVAQGMAGDITDDSIREAFLEGLETRLG